MPSRASSHSYGSKSFRKAGPKLGHTVRIEQQGSMGQINKLTPQEIADADFVLLATDQKIVGEERFEGKKKIRVNISTCIKAPEAVLKKCIQAVS